MVLFRGKVSRLPGLVGKTKRESYKHDVPTGLSALDDEIECEDDGHSQAGICRN
jgi:hypothetical protein